MLNPCTSCHNARLIVVVMLVVTMYYPALIDTAVVRSEILDEQLLLRALSGPRYTRISRSTENSDEKDTPVRYCNSACGWAVYHPYMRTIEYFMRNTCECPDKSYKCVRSGDDLSASAYVYRCRQNTTANEIEFPEDAN
ncbi:uncharacterized protein LOC126854895 [Cataglyphis hispanica]|uniref:uncharacterized protein LOC126854895 n=1 Tax=Cataglyphis hispanica TaxID=1086592 RepID=UPI00218081F2|nr:uncharacterized protein LOC126854895 [Cataglyphis hispanica]